MASNKYEKQLHDTYNDIQYIMGKNDKNLNQFKKLGNYFNVALQKEENYFKQNIEKRFLKPAIEVKNLINSNGEKIFLSEEQIAQDVTKYFNNTKNTEGININNLLSKIYSNLNQGATQAQSVYNDLNTLVRLSVGDLPSGAVISMKNITKRKNELKTLLNNANNFSSGKFSNLIGQVGEFANIAASSAITDAVTNQLAEQLSIDTNQLKVTAKVQHTGTQKYNGSTVQTDNQLQIHIDFIGDKIKAGFSMPASGLDININLSDKANKKLATLNSSRRKSTNALTFRSTKIKTILEDIPDPKLKAATYNLISYHRQGKMLVGFLNQDPGIALRRYLGYKLLTKMFLSEGDLNQVDFTVYGTNVYTEKEVYEKLYKSGKVLADIEYWTLKSLIGKFKEPKDNVEERLKLGTAEAHKRIDDMKVAIRASLALKK